MPIETLTRSGMSVKRLQLNCMSKNLTGSGIEGVFLTDPSYGVRFDRCRGFRRLVTATAKLAAERSFTVRLHFAEIDEVSAGQRVFDVALQGKTVLKDFDILDQAGGRNTALVKEFGGVRAGEHVLIELNPTGQGARGRSAPMLNAVEVVEEE